MDVFYRKVFSILDEGGAVVLPTEDAARSMLSEYVLSSSEKPSRSAVLGSSILSFDRFKELFYPSRAGKRPVDEASRMLFSAFLVERYKEKLPYFFPLSQNSVPDERMAAFISSLLRDLEDGLDYSYAPIKKDVSFIYESYITFLEKCGLYEPVFIKHGFENNLKKKYHVAFSDADMHIADFISKIDDGANIEILSFDKIATPSLCVYDNEKQEIRSLFLEIRHLIEPSGGIDPSDIIISTPSYERILPYMEREAWLFSIPLVRMRGKSPLEYPAGVFFKSLSEIHDNNYGLEEMKKFFLNPSIPFFDAGKVRDFILSAIERNVSYREDPDRFLFVRNSFVYKDLQHYLDGIYAAKSAKRLVNQIKSLMEKLLSPSQFNFPDNERLGLVKAMEEEKDKRKKESLALEIRMRENDQDVFSFIIRTLMAFSSSLESMEDAGYSYSGQLFSLFLKVLEKTVYVPQNKGEGVRIYPLGQALGVKARHHFIAGLNEAESRCVLKRAPFLSDYEAEGDRECGDFTIPMLSSYQLGSDEVHLSASFELYTGSAIPLLDLEIVRPSSKIPDSYADMAFINKDGLEGYKIYPVQKGGYERALLTSLDIPSRDEDLAEDMPMPLDGLNRKSWTFSYTQLDCYERCPYVYALRYIYGLDRIRKYDVEEYPAGEIGQRLHRVCELYVDSSSFDARSVVPALLDRELDLWKKGIAERYFVPVFHGREHLNVQFWIRALQSGNKFTLLGFDNCVTGIPHKDIYGNKIPGVQAAFNIETLNDLPYLKSVIKNGLNLFEELYGYRSTYFVPTNGYFNNSLEKDLYENGIKYINTAKKQQEPLGNDKYRINTRFLGQKNELGQIYLTRNCFFEPSATGFEVPSNYDWVNYCLKEIEIAFRWHKPATISSHRVNYIGFLHPENRERGLKQLTELLTKMLKKWPDIEFMTSVELGNLIAKNKF